MNMQTDTIKPLQEAGAVQKQEGGNPLMSYFDEPQNGEPNNEDENSIGQDGREQNGASINSAETVKIDATSRQSAYSDESHGESNSRDSSKNFDQPNTNGEASKDGTNTDKEQMQNNVTEASSKPGTAEQKKKSTKDNNQENEQSNSLLAEAERQAAIAAALSQTTSASPSAVVGLAKQLATNSISGTSSGDVFDANSGVYAPTVVALPPLPSDSAAGSTGAPRNSAGRPPPGGKLGAPVPLPAVMKPVRFDDVKRVLVRLLSEKNEDIKRKSEVDEDCQIEIEIDSSDANNVTVTHEANKQLEVEGCAIDANKRQEDNSTEDSRPESNVEATDESSTNPNPSLSDATPPPATTIPDSFIRFLLLVARVPIIVEEGKQLHRQKQRSLKDSEANSLAAAKRALEIYKLSKVTYDRIEEKRGRVASGKEEDATSAFFASCAGEDSTTNGANGLNQPNLNDTHGNSSPTSTAHSPKQPRIKQRRSSTTMGSPAATAMSTMFSNVISKVSKKQHSTFSDLGKKLMSGSAHKESPPASPTRGASGLEESMKDYEIIIDQEMLGLTVENVLERTIIRTLLPEGAAKRAGAKIGSLIAKVGNVDTSNLTHFETIDELRQSQRPLKLTLRHISGEVLRCAREEMGRLIRGRDEDTTNKIDGDKPWRENSRHGLGERETFDSILRDRWPSKKERSLLNPNATPATIMTRNEMIHRTGKDLIRILSLMIVGMEKELAMIDYSVHSSFSSCGDNARIRQLKEAIEITSKILLEYARKHPDVDEKFKSDRNTGSGPASSFYPVPPGRVGKKNLPPPPRGQKGGKGKKGQDDTPLLRIGDALQRTTSFLVEPTSSTATTLRWEIIDYLCVVLDLDSENELAEKEAASSTEGGGASQIDDLGSAGSILKLIVVNCSTVDDSISLDGEEKFDGEFVSSLEQSSSRSSAHASHSGNPFLSVVHRLAASKSTSARVSACSLGPVLWSHLDFPRQLQLRGVITRALHDVEITVRKSTATVLHEIAELVFDRRSVPWLVLMCERSMTDPEPQLRAAAMTLTWHLAEHLPNAFLGDASKGSRSLRRLPPRTDPTFMDVYLLQCKLLPVASNLAEDKMPSVRLSVAAQCDRLCSAMGEHWFNVIIDLLQALLSDADERVRSEAVLCMPRLVESVVVGTSKGQQITVLESLLPKAFKIQSDSSPEVRSALATATGDLLIFLVGADDNSNDIAPPSPGRGAISTPSLYKKYVDDTLIPILQKLLQDLNPEVTTASLRAVTNASRSSAVASSTRIPSTSHNYDTVDDDMVSISSHQSLQSHTSFDRRKPVFIPVLSEEQVLRLLPTLSNLATSKEWRVRQSAVEIVPALLGCTYRHETRHEISKFCLKLMSDKVDAVRKTAAECLCLGGSSLARHGEDDGGAWITNIVIPHLTSCSRSDDSKQRLLCLKMIEIIITNGLCPAPKGRNDSNSNSKMDISLNSSFDTATDSVCGDPESPVKMILDIASSLASDKVANVRLNVGRVFVSVIPLLHKTDSALAVSILEKQLEEEKGRDGGGDRDVIYFAQQAMSCCLQLTHRLSSFDPAE